MPKISVLMPVYNTKEEWLKEAVESILNQTYKDFEFIIIDDNKNDVNENFIRKYSDKRIRYIKGNNTGIAGALNKGIEIANGEYIARMDSDDISLCKRFAKQSKYLDENPDISIVGSWFEIFPETKIIKHPTYPKYLDILKYCCIGHPTIMFRKADFEKFELKYNQKYFCEDYELWSRAIRVLKFYNIQEVLLKYRWYGNNASAKPKAFDSSLKIQQNMLDFLTDDKELQHEISKLLNIIPAEQKNYNKSGLKRKILSILGKKLKFKIPPKIYIVKLMGGLGNQMFQYAFGKGLEKATGEKVIYDKSWFDVAKKNIVNYRGENSDGVVIRNYNLDIFNINIPFADKKQIETCKKYIHETKEFEYDKNLLKKHKSAIYKGYFQNEKYFKSICEDIKKDFTFPAIPNDDTSNINWLQKIKECENPVFIHLRRGDYVNLGWDLSADYYKRAVEYIKKYVNNPKFFIFGQDCEDFIKAEFNTDNFEIIGENNSKNGEDWKDIALMFECKHAIIANSTFSWWAAWLGRANEEGIVVAPTPFVNGKDSIICDNWVKIKR